MGHSYRKRPFIKDITSACHRVVSIQLPRDLVLRGVNSTCKETALAIAGTVVKARVRQVLRGDRFCEVLKAPRVSQKSKPSCRRARELSIVNVSQLAGTWLGQGVLTPPSRRNARHVTESSQLSTVTSSVSVFTWKICGMVRKHRG